MSLQTNPELFWLTLVTLATGLMWVPHILQLIAQEGLFQAIYDPSREMPHKVIWAQRARRAHENAVENLAIFAPLVILVAVAGSGTEQTALAAMIFFFARVGHFLAYAMAIPFARVLSFAIGWGCQMIFAFNLLGWM